MTAAKAFYFCYFGAGASLVPFLVLYYERVGLSGAQIGLLAGLVPLVTLLSAPAWGAAADLSQRHRFFLVLAIAGTLLSVLALSFATSFLALLPLIVAYALCIAPVVPLVDSSVMAHLGKRKSQYGRQRLWGAVGWGLCAPVVGWLADRAGLHWIFYGFLILMAGCLLVSLRLPVIHAPKQTLFWSRLRLLLANWVMALFLATAFVSGVGFALLSNYLFLYLHDLGASETLMGVSMTVATVSEVPIFFFSDRILRRWGAGAILTLALTGFVLRLLAQALVPIAWVVVLIQVLHGPTFAAFWMAGVSYVDEIAPEGMSGTAQALFSAVSFGLGGVAGGLLGGFLYEAVGGQAMFLYGGIGGIVALFLRFAAARRLRHAQPVQAEL